MTVDSPYRVTCSCGTSIPVQKSAAGSQIVCPCGTAVEVPRLSDLRRMAGEAAFIPSTFDRVQQMLHDMELPLGEACLLSMRPTKDVVHVRIECEMPYRRGGSTRWGLAFTALLTLMCSWLFIFHYLASRGPVEWLGRELVVRVPLRVSADCQPEFRRLSSAQIKQLLSTVPIYAQLLADYPRAKVFVD